jgi:pimeloyl-ACP methyl ester carboxylesterase
MIFKEFGSIGSPVIVLLHGGGLSWWSWKRQIELLRKDHFVVTPVIDGHGEDGDTLFTGISPSAEKLISYINEKHNGKVLAVCGLSIGAQIAVELLSMAPNITEYAVLESALVIPMKYMAEMTAPIYKMSYGLIKKRWFAKLQSKTLFVPEESFPDYFADSSRMSRESLINMSLSNGSYSLPQGVSCTSAKTLILAGEKELPVMKKSARLLHETIGGSTLKVMDKYGHGELSLANPDEYIRILSGFIREQH